MVKKTYWLTIHLILLSIILSFILKGLFSPSFIPRFSVTASILGSIILASVILIFVFKPLKKHINSLTVFQEKYKEAKNLLEKSNKELDEKNGMLRKKTETLIILNRINKAMISTFDLGKILDLIIEAVEKELNFDRIIIFLLEDGTLIAKKCTGIAESELEKISISTTDKNNFIVQTIIEARPRIYIGTDNNSLPGNFNELYRDIKPELMASVPLISKEKTIGLLLVDNIITQRKIEERDIRAVSVFTNQAGLAIDNARLFELDKNFTDELKKQIEIAKKKLEQAQAQLIKSEKLTALGKMAAIVAHEVRNPMSSIRAGAQRISKKLSDDDPNKKYTRYIMEESDRLERVVKTILIFSKESEPRFEPNDMNKLIKDVLFFLQPEIKKVNVRLIKNLEPTLPAVNIDPALMRQVLLNIIQNALYFMSDTEIKELNVATLLDSSNIIVEVSDTGPGIPRENMQKIFDPFFTTKPSGTGLGLAICNRIIESHMGRIDVQSGLTHGVTHGAVFKIILPTELNPTSVG